MTGDQHDIVAILVKYALREPLTQREEQALEEWRQRSAEHAAMPEQFRDPEWLEEQRRQMHTPPTDAMWEDIRNYIDESGDTAPVFVMPTKRRIGMGWYPVAVLLLAGMIYGGMWFKHKRQQEVRVTQTVAPLIYKVLLTLDGGSMVVLDTLKKGAVVAEGPVRVRKTDTNSYVYTIGGANRQAMRHRLIVAPGARASRIQWPDGSNAWLKGGTNLDYAVDLRSGEVKVEGEAWFRLAHVANRPMTLAMSDGTLVRVLGTSFDVRSNNRGVDNRVALFSGKVRVVKGADSLELRPGRQALTGPQGIKTKEVDSNTELAWIRPAVKTRDFDFEDADLLTMMPEIAAWYRVQVVNPQNLRGAAITGDFLRSMPLPDLIGNIKKIEGSYVHINLREDTIFITP